MWIVFANFILLNYCHIEFHATFNNTYFYWLIYFQRQDQLQRRLKDRFHEHRRPMLNPTGNYIPTAVSEHSLTSNHSNNHMLLIPIEKLKMGVILSGKHAKPTLSTKLRQLGLWALINVMNCNYILIVFFYFFLVILSF